MSHRFFSKIVLIALVVCGLSVSCSKKKADKTQQPPQKILSLDPADSVAYHELLAFYLNEGILPSEAFDCQHDVNGGLHSLCCLTEEVQECWCVPDYMQDSLHGTFFQEIDIDMGSSGDGIIYICEKNAQGFRILYTVVGTIDLDEPADQFQNGYRVIYFTTDGGENKRKLFFDGKTFVEEDIPDNTLANN